MKAGIIFVLLLFVSKLGVACSGFPKGFCLTHAERPGDPVLKGAIIAVGAQSIQLKVLAVLNGVESRSVVTIWDGTDFNCNGLFSMKASLLGGVGDTILAILPIITSTLNTWDVPGDYRRPYYLFYEPVLRIRNDSLIGVINTSSVNTLPYWQLTNMSYGNFVTYWTSHQNDCLTLVGIRELSSNQTPEIIVSRDAININVQAENYLVQISTVDGKIIFQKPLSGKNDIPIETTEPGVYFVSVYFENGRVYRKKLLCY